MNKHVQRDRSPSIKSEISAYGERIMMHAVESLIPYPRNARTHSKKQIRQIARSIERFGFTNPVLIDDQNMILAGHGRVEAAKTLGIGAVPCLRLAEMSEAEKRAYILADNKIAQNAGWDDDLLATELEFILEEGIIDIADTGFSVSEVDTLLETGESGQMPQDDRDDSVPPSASEPAVTRPGDVWVLGEHKLVCGDARDDGTYQLLMGNETGRSDLAQMVFTDPPYNVRIKGNVSGSARHAHREFIMGSGEMSRDVFAAFLEASFSRMAEWSCDGSIHFICMDWRHTDEISAAGRQVYTELKNMIVWVKDNAGMGSFYRTTAQRTLTFPCDDEKSV